MFDYLRNEHNPEPRLVVDPSPPPTGMVARCIPLTESILVDLPDDVAALKARHSSKYWSTLRRKKRRFADEFGELRLDFVDDPEELRALLPAVQQLFAARWEGEYVSLGWKTAGGFAPYADAMVDLASSGRGMVAAAIGDGRLLAFAYCVIEDGCCYFYQHASDRSPRYARYSVGKQLVAELLCHLVEHQAVRQLDFMLGDAPYKSEWATSKRTVYVQLLEPSTVPGRARLAVRSLLTRLMIYAQHENPRIRAAVKRAMAMWQRLGPSSPPENQVASMNATQRPAVISKGST